jgi:hypothetical protein
VELELMGPRLLREGRSRRNHALISRGLVPCDQDATPLTPAAMHPRLLSIPMADAVRLRSSRSLTCPSS